jgi:N6-L-threonylcarbamoyladenine synthase
VQESIAASLCDRVCHALDGRRPTALVVAGGVAANTHIRNRLAEVAQKAGIAFLAPPVALCGDNAAMIAWAALERQAAGIRAGDDGHPRPRWALDASVAGR